MGIQGAFGYIIGKKKRLMHVQFDADLLWQICVREIYLLMKHYGSLDLLKTAFENLKEAKNKPRISKWILLQDWSQCTLACGGGQSYRHRFCLQPEGAPACTGKSIESKTCNTQPCDRVTQVINSDKITQLPPIVKMMRISNKPAKFIVNIN